jgi:hypothetical protein
MVHQPIGGAQVGQGGSNECITAAGIVIGPFIAVLE